MIARDPQRIVHLGNVGIEGSTMTGSSFSALTAKLTPERMYYGVDLEAASSQMPENYRHLQYEFVEGLSAFADNSLSHISSQLALGYYSKEGSIIIPVATGSSWVSSLPVTTLKEIAWDRYTGSRMFDRTKTSGLIRYTNECLKVAYQKLIPGKCMILNVCPIALNIIEKAAKGIRFSNMSYDYGTDLDPNMRCVTPSERRASKLLIEVRLQK